MKIIILKILILLLLVSLTIRVEGRENLIHSRFDLRPTGKEKKSCGENCVDVVIAANGPYMTPLLACINSIQQNTQRDLYFHILTSPGDAQLFLAALGELVTKHPVEIVEFSDTRVKPLIRVWEGKNTHVYYNTFNYARFYLPELFPDVAEMVYLDPDTIVPGDLGTLLDLFRNRTDKTLKLAAVPSKTTDTKHSHYCFLVNCDEPLIRSVVKRPESKFFNAGVFATDLGEWRSSKITQQLEDWMLLNTQKRLWRWGSQGPLVLVFYGQWLELPREWNERNARKKGEDDEDTQLSQDVKIYHFTSMVKPWKYNGRALWSLWCQYYPKPEKLWFCKKGDIQNLFPSSPYDFTFVKNLWDPI